MKLIHSGKVLKDEDKIESCNIKPNDFLVVMIAKVSSWLCTIAVLQFACLDGRGGCSGLGEIQYAEIVSRTKMLRIKIWGRGYLFALIVFVDPWF